MKCPLCIKKNPKTPDQKNLNDPDEHMIITFKDGHTHIHGPFSNEYVIREMLKSFISEMEKKGMPYYPSTDHQIGS